MSGPVKLSASDIDSRKTPKGGWTKATLAEWGVPWPPPPGWREALMMRGAPYQSPPPVREGPPISMDEVEAIFERALASGGVSGASESLSAAWETIKRCPECHGQCNWCGLYRHQARQGGCGDMLLQRQCDQAKAERGKTCGTCDGSRTITVRHERVATGGRS